MNALPIRRLVIKRFRSFPAATLELSDNPLFVVGRNGSGKTNLAGLFSFLAEAMSSPLQAVFDRRGGIEAVRNRSSGRSYPPNLGLAIEFGPANGLTGGRYAFEVKALKNHGFQVVHEQCQLIQASGDAVWFDRTDQWRSNVAGLAPALEPAALALPLIGGDARFATIFKTLDALRVYAIEPAKLREMQDPDSGVALKWDGSNAASVLQELSRGNRDNSSRNEINAILETIVPATKSVSPKKHGNKLSMSFVQTWGGDRKKLAFDAFNMSDGTLRSLGLIMAVFQQSSPSVLVIEEPEATIHPGALGAILDLIRRASRSMQVVVTTHSPELLDAPWITEANLRLVVWHEGASYLLPPADAALAAMRQHLMGAGELLRTGVLQPEDPDLFSRPDAMRQGELFETFA